jgi:hypothetical protein
MVASSKDISVISSPAWISNTPSWRQTHSSSSKVTRRPFPTRTDLVMLISIKTS